MYICISEKKYKHSSLTWCSLNIDNKFYYQILDLHIYNKITVRSLWWFLSSHKINIFFFLFNDNIDYLFYDLQKFYGPRYCIICISHWEEHSAIIKSYVKESKTSVSVSLLSSYFSRMIILKLLKNRSS